MRAETVGISAADVVGSEYCSPASLPGDECDIPEVKPIDEGGS